MQSNTSRAREKQRATDPHNAHLRYKEQADAEGEVDAEGAREVEVQVQVERES